MVPQYPKQLSEETSRTTEQAPSVCRRGGARGRGAVGWAMLIVAVVSSVALIVVLAKVT